MIFQLSDFSLKKKKQVTWLATEMFYNKLLQKRFASMYECIKQKTSNKLKQTDQCFLLSTQAMHVTNNIVMEE